MKHYIRINAKNLVVHAFSEAFETGLPTDICTNQNGGRHYQLDLMDTQGLYKYRWDSVLNALVEDLGATQITEHKTLLLGQLRSKRNILLAETDKYMISDFVLPVGVTKTMMVSYRNTLRNLPTTQTTLAQLETPSWPTKLI